MEIKRDKNIKEISISYDYGMSSENLEQSKTAFTRIHLFGYDANKLKNSGIKLNKGRMPQNSNELIIGIQSSIRIGKEKNIGYELELTFEGNTKKYTIVGLAESLEGDNINDNFSDGKDNRLGAVTLLENEKLQEDTIVNVDILTHNIKKVYETTRNLEQKLNLSKITNVNKVTGVDRNELETPDLPEWFIATIPDMGTMNNEEVEISSEKVEYNNELLQTIGASEEINTSFDIFVAVRFRIYSYY